MKFAGRGRGISAATVESSDVMNTVYSRMLWYTMHLWATSTGSNVDALPPHDGLCALLLPRRSKRLPAPMRHLAYTRMAGEGKGVFGSFNLSCNSHVQLHSPSRSSPSMLPLSSTIGLSPTLSLESDASQIDSPSEHDESDNSSISASSDEGETETCSGLGRLGLWGCACTLAMCDASCVKQGSDDLDFGLNLCRRLNEGR